MKISIPFRDGPLSKIPYLVDALDLIVAAISATFGVEHHDDGTHADVTCDSLSVADAASVTDGNVTGNLIPTTATATLGALDDNAASGVGVLTRWDKLYINGIYFGQGVVTLTGHKIPLWTLTESGVHMLWSAGQANSQSIGIRVTGTTIATFGGSATIGTSVALQACTIPILATSTFGVSGRAELPGVTKTTRDSIEISTPTVTASVANNGVMSLGVDTAVGLLVVIAVEDNAPALFAIAGTGHATVEMSDPFGLFSAASGTAASNNIYWSAGNARYELENKRGSARTYRLFQVGV
jgi:hypothetical protein